MSFWDAVAAVAHARLQEILSWEDVSADEMQAWGVSGRHGDVSLLGMENYPEFSIVTVTIGGSTRLLAKHVRGRPVERVFKNTDSLTEGVAAIVRELNQGDTFGGGKKDQIF